MTFLFQLFAKYAGLIYIACAIGVAFSIRDILAAREQKRITRFSLEREEANSRIVRGSIGVVLFLGLIVVTSIIANDVAPAVIADATRSTSTPSFILPTGTPTPTIQPTATHKPTRTPAPTSAVPVLETPTPEPPTVEPTPWPISCPAPNVQLTAPTPGQIVSGEFQLFGTATAPNFAFYKFTLKGPGTNNVELTAGEPVHEPKQAYVLGSLDLSVYLNQPGLYFVSLVVVDNTGSEYPHCVVPILVQPAQ